MKDANDAQLKIYLYLLRMMGARRATSVSDIADKFNHTEKDVMRALKYWEKAKLLSLEYDAARNLSSIRLLTMNSKTPAEIVPLTPVAAMPIKETPSVKEGFEKPSYTLDELKSFKNNEETAQLLFVAEQYIGKPLSASEINTILFFSDKLGFSSDLIDYLIQYCVDKGKKSFRYIEKVAVSWAQEGITTARQAADTIHQYDKTVYDIMKALGKSASPTRKEAEYAKKWTGEYGFTLDIILEACERTVLSTDKHRFEYADSILSSWHKKNIRHKADIKVLDDAYQGKKAAKPSYIKTSQFNQFMQTNYDFDALEKEILSN